MSVVVQAVAPAESVDNSYINVVNKRIRAYKKKVERIVALRQLPIIDKEQKELISHYDVYSSILNELIAIKTQLHEVAANDSATKVILKNPEYVELTSDEIVLERHAETVIETVAEPVVEEKKEEVDETVVGVVVSTEAVESVTETDVCDAVVNEEAAIEAEEKSATEPVAVEKKDVRPNAHYPRYPHQNGEERQDRSGEHRQRYPRRDGNQGFGKNGIRRGEKKNANDEGWTIPKKVAYVKKEE